MKTALPALALVLASFALLFNTPLASASRATPGSQRPRLALKSTDELRSLLDARVQSSTTPALFERAPTAEEQEVLIAGKRVYDWINLLNSNRASALPPLSYSNPGNMSNPSVESPKIYDAQTGIDQFRKLKTEMPQAYLAVITGAGALPTALPVSETDFLDLGLKVTNAYDITARWILMQDWIEDLKSEQVFDMRGYVFLSRMNDRDVKFANFASLPVSEQANLRLWLVDICLNGQLPSRMDRSSCIKQISTAETQNKLAAFYSAKIRDAKFTYDAFFTLDVDWIRSDLTWTAKEPGLLHYPFLTISDPSVAAYLKDNVEDEFRGTDWRLQIDFMNQGRSNLSHLEYEPNTTAHAEANKIVMDENEPRTEYLSQWTIRHEFGHLLGFKDCYVEFYDESIQKIVNFPLDPTNIMCSRRGSLQPQHVDKLRARYFRP